MNIVKFADVAHRANTKEDRFATDKIYYVGGEHIDTNELVIHHKGIIKGSTIGPMFYCGFKSGQILFVTRNPHLRKCSIAYFDGICSEKTFVIESTDKRSLLQEYLALVMQSNDFWDYCEENKSGGVNYFVNWSTLAEYEFELPPLAVQKKLVEKVLSAYRLKESYKRLLTATQEMVKSRFIEMFGDTTKVILGDYIATQSGGTPNTKKSEYYDGGDIPWLSSGEVNQGYIYATEKYITELGLNKSSAKWIPEDAILIAMYGATAGKVGYAKIPMTTNQAVCALLPNEYYDPLFLYYAVSQKTDWMIEQCRGAAQPNISQGIIKSMEIPLPSMEQQQLFVAIAEQSDKSVFEIKKSIDAIDAVIKSLING